jgi:hypothetical protein
MVYAAMSPRLGIIKADVDGWPILPQVCEIEYQGATIVAPVWDQYFPCSVGGYDAREFRYYAYDRLFVVVRVASVTLPDSSPALLSIAFVPSAGIVGANATWDLVAHGPTMAPVIVAQWEIEQDADGALVVPSLESDSSDAATLAKAAWPADWRKRLVTDQPDPAGGEFAPMPLPTGPRIIGIGIG